MKTAWILGIALALVPGGLMAASYDDVAPSRELLLGTWAPDCSQPVSRQNPYLEYSDAGGGAITYQPLIADRRDLLPSQTVTGFQPLQGNLMRSKFVRNSDGDITIVTQKFEGGRMWSLNAEDPNGTLHISNGKFAESGEDVPRLMKCSDKLL